VQGKYYSEGDKQWGVVSMSIAGFGVEVQVDSSGDISGYVGAYQSFNLGLMVGYSGTVKAGGLTW
jgi:hypothetical protein